MSKVRSLFTTMEAAYCRELLPVATEVGSGNTNAEAGGGYMRAVGMGCDQYHGFTRASKGDRVGDGFRVM